MTKQEIIEGMIDLAKQHPDFTGSFFLDVLEAMKSSLRPNEFEPAQKGEVPIAQMNDLEVALDGLRKAYQKEGNSMARVVIENGLKIADDAFRLRHLSLHERAEAASSHLWDEMRNRLARENIPDLGGLAIRENCQIVRLAPEPDRDDDEECDCDVCKLRRMFSA